MYWNTSVAAERLMMTYAVSSASIRPSIVQCTAPQSERSVNVYTAGRHIIMRISMTVSAVSTRDLFSLSSILHSAVPTMPMTSIIRLAPARSRPPFSSIALRSAIYSRLNISPATAAQFGISTYCSRRTAASTAKSAAIRPAVIYCTAVYSGMNSVKNAGIMNITLIMQ